MRTNTAGGATGDAYATLFESNATGTGTDGRSAYGIRIRCNHASNSIKVRCDAHFGSDEHIIAPSTDYEEFFCVGGIAKFEVANADSGSDSSYDLFAVTVS